MTPEYKARILKDFRELQAALDKVLKEGAQPTEQDYRNVRNAALGSYLGAEALADDMSGKEKERAAIFDQVKNRKDWKLPINAVVIRSSQELVADAISFYTGSIATFEPVKGKPAYVRVRAPGYYAASGG